ncbi:MAG: TIGR01777 family oxidoreductase [Pseudomonadota bacterium]
MTSDLLWTLILIQIAMGAFDSIYHHELTERLPWRASQQHELALHAVRNILYAAVFILIGWFETHGVWAVVLLTILTIEVIVTLLDFVEEDMSRALPASERINHTLLALNYGAILSLLVPVLVEWSRDATALKPVYHGFWSILTGVSAAGVIISGTRDYFASRRAKRLVLDSARGLAAAIPEPRHVLVTGATGFIGPRVVEALSSAGHRVTVLARDPAKATKLRPPFRLITSLDQITNDETIDTIINLAGEPVANGFWTKAKRRKILRSRLSATRDVVRLIARLDTTPSLLINGSAIGWYGLRGDETLTEASRGKACFTNRICDAWERMAARAELHGTRVVWLRIGLVLGTEGGFLSRLLTPFESGLGGPIGNGQQWMSWIERDDLVRLIAHVIVTPRVMGAVNATAPVPVRNAEFTRALAHAFRRPAFLPIPASMLRLLGDFADELFLASQKVLPEKITATGFEFRHTTIESALSALLQYKPCEDGMRHTANVAVAGSRAKA